MSGQQKEISTFETHIPYRTCRGYHWKTSNFLKGVNEEVRLKRAIASGKLNLVHRVETGEFGLARSMLTARREELSTADLCEALLVP